MDGDNIEELSPGEERYPKLLASSRGAPAPLYVRGLLQPSAPRVAIVGSRACDSAGLRIARALAEELAQDGVEIVSGGARGVDAAAHAGALWGGGSTVAVLGCGVDRPYPPEHGALFARLAGGRGALVSEFPPGTPPRAEHFPRRNRTLAALAAVTVVVRAGPGSGALYTARHARSLGRPLFAVPPPAGLHGGEGTARLLARGEALPLTRGAAELLDALAGVLPPSPCARWTGRNIVPLGLDAAAAGLLGLLGGRRPRHLDWLAARTSLPTPVALKTLQTLELMGLCLQRPGKYYLRR